MGFFRTLFRQNPNITVEPFSGRAPRRHAANKRRKSHSCDANEAPSNDRRRLSPINSFTRRRPSISPASNPAAQTLDGVTRSPLPHARCDAARGPERVTGNSESHRDLKPRDASVFGRWVLITGGQSEASLAEWILMEAVYRDGGRH